MFSLSFRNLFKLLVVVAVQLLAGHVYASCFTAWQGDLVFNSSVSAAQACASLIDAAGKATHPNAPGGRADTAHNCFYYNTGGAATNFGQWSESPQECTPIPPTCPVGSSWDWDNNRCSYPQDDACGAVGAQWNPDAQRCDCTAPKVLVVTGDVARCLEPAPEQECTPDSPDFSGYGGPVGNVQPICAGRNRCPDGSKPGFAGVGDDVTAVCLGGEDPNCPDGQGGIWQGKYVCLPQVGQDPRCALNETPGYVGTGANKEFTCLPGDYGNKTCPPGQVLSFFGGSASCASTSKDTPSTNPDGTPNKPGKVTGTVTGSGEGGTGTGGGGTGTSELELDFSALIENAPKDNAHKDLVDFGDSVLDGIDTDSMVGEFAGDDGAFTQRSSLDNAADFIVSRTIGSGANCTGAMPFFDYNISCEKLDNMNRVLGWFIFVSTAFGIFGVLTRPSASGV